MHVYQIWLIWLIWLIWSYTYFFGQKCNMYFLCWCNNLGQGHTRDFFQLDLSRRQGRENIFAHTQNTQWLRYLPIFYIQHRSPTWLPWGESMEYLSEISCSADGLSLPGVIFGQSRSRGHDVSRESHWKPKSDPYLRCRQILFVVKKKYFPWCRQILFVAQKKFFSVAQTNLGCSEQANPIYRRYKKKPTVILGNRRQLFVGHYDETNQHCVECLGSVLQKYFKKWFCIFWCFLELFTLSGSPWFPDVSQHHILQSGGGLNTKWCLRVKESTFIKK